MNIILKNMHSSACAIFYFYQEKNSKKLLQLHWLLKRMEGDETENTVGGWDEGGWKC